MKYRKEEMINQEKEELLDLLQDLKTRIQEIREEFMEELESLEDMIEGI